MDSRYGIPPTASGSGGPQPTTTTIRKPRKKIKPQNSSAIPQPYLALAPSPLTSVTAPTIYHTPGPTRTPLVLPSTWRRTEEQQAAERSKTPKPTTKPRTGYAAGLMAPPAVVPGGSSAVPRIQGQGESSTSTTVIVPLVISRRQSREQLRPRQSEERIRPGTRQEGERLRDLRGNASMLSLGQLGQIMEADPVVETPEDTPQRRRRRIVRGEDGGTLARRLTVTSREEGRALGLARGASMRRLNVWDDLPETQDAPPAFPFPTPSTSRNPPTFDSPAAPAYQAPESPSPAPTTLPITPLDGPPPLGRPLSPPPTWDQAMGHSPLPHAPITLPTHAARPSISITTSVPPSTTDPPSPASPASTHYVSAPQSPDGTHLSQDSEMGMTADEREDRKAWNADLLAGYGLEERVRREGLRRAARDSKRKEEEDGAENVGEESFEDAQDGGDGVAASRPEETKQTTPLAADTTVLLRGGSQEERPTATAVPQASESSNAEALSGAVVDDAQIGASGSLLFGLESSILPAKSVNEDSAGGDLSLGAEQGNPKLSLRSEASAKTAAAPSDAVLARPLSPLQEDTAAKGTNPEGADGPTACEYVAQGSDVTSDIIDHLRKVDKNPNVSEGSSAPKMATQPMLPPESPTIQRKLTRGHVVRHSTSTTDSSPYARNNSIRAKRVSRLAPLFSSSAYSSQSTKPNLDEDQIQASPEVAQIGFMHRQSAPTLGDVPQEKGVTDRTYSLGGQMFPLLDEGSVRTSSRFAEKTLPPHREAALKRRELALRRMDEPQSLPQIISAQKPSHSRAKSGPLPSSGPLIDFNDFSFAPTEPLAPSLVFPGLQRSAFSKDLLELFGEEGGVAESSKQGAKKAAVVHDIASAGSDYDHSRGEYGVVEKDLPPLPDRVREEGSSRKGKSPSIRSVASTSSRRRMPPPPPVLYTYASGEFEGARDSPERSNLSPSRSVLSSATSPITPRPNPTCILDDSSPTPKPRIRSIPTRRPPPPPPPRSTSDTRSIRSTTSSDPPPLPPRPPPAFASRPAHLHHQSNISIQTSSSISFTEKDDFAKTPVSPYRMQKRLSMTAKPRGPRPPPPPPRPWAKGLAGGYASAPIPTRSMSADSILSPHMEHDGKILPVQTTARPGVARETSLEYTDLDVIMARLEGTGREYEGFTDLATFLGPSKDPAATPAALANLLPGPIIIDSKRTTAQGKVKLKLSLLGVRISKCPICLSQFRDKEKGVMMPDCGHVAHEGCALRWFEGEGRCFVCREPLREGEGVV